MAQLLECTVSANAVINISEMLGIIAPDGLVIQNISEDIPVYLSTTDATSWSPAAITEEGPDTNNCWALRPGETLPKLNLTSGQILYGQASGAHPAVIQVCADS